MLRQLHKISNKLTDKFNNKIKSSNYYFLSFLLLVYQRTSDVAIDRREQRYWILSVELDS